MKTRPKYLIATLCGLMILIACTAGCTSSTTSPSPQASAAPSAGRSDKFTNKSDSPGSDPDPSVLPRYEPSVRVISPEKNVSTGWVYKTKDPVSSVKAFYKTQMPKLGYNQTGSESNTPEEEWSAFFAKGNTTFVITATGPNEAEAKYDFSNVTTIGLTPTPPVQVTPIPA